MRRHYPSAPDEGDEHDARIDEQAGQPRAPLLAVDDVTLQYKTEQHLVTATWRVGFEVYEGERFVVLGPSGLRQVDAAQGGRGIHGSRSRGRSASTASRSTGPAPTA